jgi:Papain-like cysteine protease AvrRpt2
MLSTADVVTQERSFWCWAAVVEMLHRHFELAHRRQCEIVSSRLGRDCCPEPRPSGCNVQHYMASFDDLLRTEGIACRGSGPRSPLDERQLSDELYSDRPVVIGWIWDQDGSGHFVLAFPRPRAGKKKPHKLLYKIADPRLGFREITYEGLRNPEGGTWSWSWYNLRAS